MFLFGLYGMFRQVDASTVASPNPGQPAVSSNASQYASALPVYSQFYPVTSNGGFENAPSTVPKMKGYAPGWPLYNSSLTQNPDAKSLKHLRNFSPVAEAMPANMNEVNDDGSQFPGTLPIASISPGPSIEQTFIKQTVATDSDVCSGIGK